MRFDFDLDHLAQRDLAIHGAKGDNEMQERCGIIVVSGASKKVRELIALTNIADDTMHDFAISAGLVNYWRQQIPFPDDIVGCWHTHPYYEAPTPSKEDYEGAPTDGVGLVYHHTSGWLTWYDQYGILKITNLEHEQGAHRDAPPKRSH